MADSLASLLGLDLAALPLPTVQLQHFLPDGASHIDWMIAQDSAGRLPLMTFRLSKPLHDFPLDTCEPADRLPDHRSIYLHYEGPVSNNRGRVVRLATGCVESIRQIDDATFPTIELTTVWPLDPSTHAETSDDPLIVAMRHIHGDAWTARRLVAHQPPATTGSRIGIAAGSAFPIA
jgi:hypothetical protein